MSTVRARVWRFSVENSQVVRAQPTAEGNLPVSLARLIHVNAMACDWRRTLDYQVRQCEVRLMASYLNAPDDSSSLSLDHHAFEASSRHIRSFVSESSGLGVLTAAGEALFAWRDGAHTLHSFDALPKQLLQHYRPTGVRPDLLFNLPAGAVAGEARGRHRRSGQLLPARLLAEQKKRLGELAKWSATHHDHTFFMSWVWIGRSGVAVDIFLPDGEDWDGALDDQWEKENEADAPETRFPLHDEHVAEREELDALPAARSLEPVAENHEPDARMGAQDAPLLRAVTHEVQWMPSDGAHIAPGSPQQQAADVVNWLYETAPPYAGAELAGISVRGAWAAADALGPARHKVLLAVLAEQPPRQTAVRERLARAGGRFDACLDGRLLTVVSPAALPPPPWHELERVLLGER